MFDDFDAKPFNKSDFVNNTNQSNGLDVSDLTRAKAISKTITINQNTIDLVEEMLTESRVDFSQMVRAGILALHGMDLENRNRLFDACYVPRNAGRKKNKHTN
ncbi:hypothetical protein [Vibrio ichthyoenteri]|nr:hypothetical protein [Vibrio ichthyoenteri]